MSDADAARQSIDARQVMPEAARLLRAYTREYRIAKRFASLRRTVGFALAVGGPVSKLLLPSVTPWVAAMAGAWLLVGRLVLTPAEERHVGRAVRFQERFDTRLFGLPWPSALAGGQPSEEDVAAASRKLAGDEDLDRRIREGWYPPTAGLPHPVDVLVAQMSSVAWGRRQHAAYYQVVWAIATLAGVAAIGVGLSMTLAEWLVTFLLPAMPALVDAADLGTAHRDIAARKQELEERVQALWEAELASPGALTVENCRAMQDEAFKLRSKGLQVPEWFYKFNRDRDETTMREAAEARRHEYNAAIASLPSNSSPSRMPEVS